MTPCGLFMPEFLPIYIGFSFSNYQAQVNVELGIKRKSLNYFFFISRHFFWVIVVSKYYEIWWKLQSFLVRFDTTNTHF
jgi:hypothetical protein